VNNSYGYKGPTSVFVKRNDRMVVEEVTMSRTRPIWIWIESVEKD